MKGALDRAPEAPGITSFTEAQLVRVARLFADDARLAAELDDLPDGGHRQRVELASTPHLQMWAISWPVGSTSDWHDHGAASGAFVVLSGSLQEDVVDAHGRVASRTFTAGESRSFSGRLVHRTLPVGDGPALSVHAYAPSLAGARSYEMTGGSRVQV